MQGFDLRKRRLPSRALDHVGLDQTEGSALSQIEVKQFQSAVLLQALL